MTMPRPSRRPTPAVNAEPNVIPFIDVMLVLLIIFMVAAPKPSTSLQVNLPSMGAIPSPVRIETTTVSLSAAGDLMIEGEAVSREQFTDRLRAVAQARNPAITDRTQLFLEARIQIAADQKASYDAVFGVVNDVDDAGFKKVNLLVQDAEI